MSWRLAKSLITLRSEFDALAPNRRKTSDGTIGDPAHASRPSRHNPNRYNVVTALDITHDPANGCDVHAIARELVKNPHPELEYIISNREIAHRNNGFRWVSYSGSNPHTKHAHFAVGRGRDLRPMPPYDSTAPWGVANTEDEVELIKTIQRALGLEEDGILGPITEGALTSALVAAQELGPHRAKFLAETTDNLMGLDARPTSLGHVLLWHRHSREAWPNPVQPGP